MKRTASKQIPLAADALSVMVLAGGRSRRMGQDKALLPMEDDQPLLLKTVQVAQSLTSNIVIVTPWIERYQALLPESVILLKEPPQPSSSTSKSAGPLSGFVYGWEAVPSAWCLLLACDMPYLEGLHLRRWWAWLQSELENPSASPSPMASLAPFSQAVEGVSRKNKRKGWEPLCGYYHRRCLPSLTQHLESGQHSFQSWLSKISVVPYYSLPEQMLFNCNTPADWAVVSDHN